MKYKIWNENEIKEISELIDPNYEKSKNTSIVMSTLTKRPEYRGISYSSFYNAVNKALKFVKKQVKKEPVEDPKPIEKPVREEVSHEVYEIRSIPTSKIQESYMQITFTTLKDFVSSVKYVPVPIYFDDTKVLYFRKQNCYSYYFTGTDEDNKARQMLKMSKE